MQTKKKKQLATFLGRREVRPGRNREGGGLANYDINQALISIHPQ